MFHNATYGYFNLKLSVIFLLHSTGFSQYIGDGYDVEALHCLMKPVDKKMLFQVPDRYTLRHRSDNRIIPPGSNESALVASDTVIIREEA